MFCKISRPRLRPLPRPGPMLTPTPTSPDTDPHPRPRPRPAATDPATRPTPTQTRLAATRPGPDPTPTPTPTQPQSRAQDHGAMGPTGPPENKSAQLETRPRPAADNWPRGNKSARPDTRPRHTGELGPGKQISTAGHTTATYWENWAPGTHVFTAGRETAPCWRAAGPAKNTAGDWTATCLKQLAPGGEKNSRRQDGDVLGGGRLGTGEPNQHSQGRRRRDAPGGDGNWPLGNKSARPDARPRRAGELGAGKRISTARGDGAATCRGGGNWALGKQISRAGDKTMACWEQLAAGAQMNAIKRQDRNLPTATSPKKQIDAAGSRTATWRGQLPRKTNERRRDRTATC